MLTAGSADSTEPAKRHSMIASVVSALDSDTVSLLVTSWFSQVSASHLSAMVLHVRTHVFVRRVRGVRVVRVHDRLVDNWWSLVEHNRALMVDQRSFVHNYRWPVDHDIRSVDHDIGPVDNDVRSMDDLWSLVEDQVRSVDHLRVVVVGHFVVHLVFTVMRVAIVTSLSTVISAISFLQV